MNYTEVVKAWLEQVVIAYNFCPFAGKVFAQGEIHYHVHTSPEWEVCLEELVDVCSSLLKHQAVETALLIFPHQLSDFSQYLQYLEIAEQLLMDQGYEGIFQLASFHPEYQFADSEKDDPANFTNRSPYPLLHILREDRLEEALQSYEHPERIPERNIEQARKTGSKAFEIILQNLKGQISS